MDSYRLAMVDHLAGHGFRTSTSTARKLSAAGGSLLAGTADTGGQFTLIRTMVPSGDSTPLHRHSAMDESFYVLSGNFTVMCGGDVFEAGAGDFVHLPRGTPHRYVAGPDGGQMLILATRPWVPEAVLSRKVAGLITGPWLSSSFVAGCGRPWCGRR